MHWRSAPFELACGRRMRALDAPKFDKDGKKINYPTWAVTTDVDLVSCPECRGAINAGPWTGRLVPLRWSLPVRWSGAAQASSA